MRYILKCRLINKKTKEVRDDYCCYGKYDMYPVFIPENKNYGYTQFKIYHSLQEAQEDLSKIVKQNRRGDKFRSQKWEKSDYERHYYLAKVDSYNFPFVLDKVNGNRYRIKKNKYHA